jgi:DNA-binding NtrC family response regulator
VETALNGADALAAVRRVRPDVVFLDITMPRMSGIEVLKEIKTIDPTIVVIMVTANEHVALAAEAIKNGAVAYVPKPFDLRYLDHIVADLVAKSGARPAR